MCSIMGGKILVSASALRRLVPSRTRSLASPMRVRAKSLESTSPEIFIPSSSGTALALRMLRVRAKRAVLRPRLTRPMTGKRSKMPCQWRRRVSSVSHQRQTMPPSASASRNQSP
ncbi:hypothetical protein D3C79_932040 [compost metagenome]